MGKNCYDISLFHYLCYICLSQLLKIKNKIKLWVRSRYSYLTIITFYYLSAINDHHLIAIIHYYLCLIIYYYLYDMIIILRFSKILSNSYLQRYYLDSRLFNYYQLLILLFTELFILTMYFIKKKYF